MRNAKRVLDYFGNVVLCSMVSFSCLNAIGQAPLTTGGYKIKLNEIIPPSPTASNLGKYGSYSVSYYTGIPSIVIPLYDLKAGSLKLPISLSYHASGIRVDDISSWIGLGWSLNAGGVISVTPMGKSDFPFVGAGEETPPRINPMTYDDITANNLTHSEETLELLSAGAYAEPDLYNYHFGPYSGQFILDNDNNVHFLKNSEGLVITFDGSNKSFVIKDNQGNTYVFDVHEYSINQGYGYGLVANGTTASYALSGNSDYGEHAISSFYLSKITSSNNFDIINFEYETDVQEYYSRISGFIETKNSSRCISGSSYEIVECLAQERTREYNSFYFPEWDLIPQSANFSCNKVTINSQRLKRITHSRSNTIITFNENSRVDIKGSKRLSSININVSGKSFLWQFNNDSYFESNIQKTETSVGYPTNNPLHKRLKLNSVQKLGDGINEEPYQFEYYGDDDPNLRLPYRNCFAGVDSWGFCNGNPSVLDAENAFKSFPNHQITVSESNPYLESRNGSAYAQNNNSNLLIFSLGGNKIPNENYVMAGSLKKIVYPTKGYSVFEYELNKYSKILNSTVGENSPAGGIRIRKITENAGLNTTPMVRNYTYAGGVVFNIPDYGTQGYVRDQGQYISNCYKIFNNPISSLTSYGEMIGYSEVIETNSNGKVAYNYYTVNDESLSTNCYAIARIDPYNGNLSINYPHVATKYFSPNIYPRVRQFDGGQYGKNFKRGLQKQVTYYNNSNILVKKEVFTYSFWDKGNIFANKVYDKLSWDAGNFGFPTLGARTSHYILYAYHHQSGKSFLSNKTTTSYDVNGNNPIALVQKFTYDTNRELLKSNEEIHGDKTIKTTITYPFDYPDLTFDESNGNRTPIHSALVEMTRKNMLDFPVEELNYVNGSWKDGKLTLYGIFTGSHLPIGVYSYKTGVPQMGSQAFDGRNENPTYFYKVATFDKYDESANILQLHKENDQTISYLWGYNRMYPIAKVENATSGQIAYTSFEGVVPISGGGYYGEEWTCGYASIYSDYSKTGRNSIESQGSTINSVKTLPAGTYVLSLWAMNKPGYTGGAITVNGQSIEPLWPGTSWKYNERTITIISPQTIVISTSGNILIDELRLYPLNAQMTTYTYDPIYGTTSQTDANGQTTYYEYDGLGRLVLIKDDKRNVIKRYDYHYSIQPL
ncbi:MAG: RHS repeat domain-containing protein [Tenuifilaceae bacterium]